MNAPVIWPGPPAGCSPNPCFDAASLLQCYCDIQATTALISKIVQNLLATDPAFTQAIVDAIAKSGSNIPLVGVTNGSDAQPGQVGEHVTFVVPNIQIPNAQDNLQLVTMGVMQPGDWDCWAYLYTNVPVDGIEYALNQITGFSNNMMAFMGNLSGLGGLGSNMTMNTPTARLSTAVPTLVVFNLSTWSTTAGQCQLAFEARRMR